MIRFRIGLQTITFGDWQVNHMADVAACAAQCGYDGLEVGYRRLGATSPAQLKALLAGAGCRALGIHAGGNLEDRAQAAGEHRVIDRVLEYVDQSGAACMLYSGLNVGADDAAMKAEIARINRAAQECAARGVALLYHNHNWEFADNWRIMRALLRDAAPQVRFCPDVGWVRKAGIDPIEYLSAIKGRIGAVHFKDFASLGTAVDTVVLGTGVVAFEPVVAWLRDNVAADELWVVAEQDSAAGEPRDAVRANADYLKRVLA